MDSEDEAEAAMQRAASDDQALVWLDAENRRRSLAGIPAITIESPEFKFQHPGYSGRNSEDGQIAFNLPSTKPKIGSSLEFDAYIMLKDLLNELDLRGENLVCFSDEDSGQTELIGKSHSVQYDLDNGRWVLGPGHSG